MKFIFILFIASLSLAYPKQYGDIINQTLIHYSFLKPALSIQIKNDTSSFASADSDGTNARVIVSTGMLNSTRLTDDGLRLILCHELGHIYGGAPRRHVPFEWDGPTALDGLSFASSEGQSDYYATISCFSELVRGQDHSLTLTQNPVSESVVKSCNHLNEDDSLICQRAILASLNFLNLNIGLNIAIETPDQTSTPILIQDQYPSSQCRLDTLVAGARCPIKKPLVMDFVHSFSNDCDVATFVRPLCWYQSNFKN